MGDVQELRDQLEEAGFTVLENTESTHSSNVLNVEAWVRYKPYALIPIPIREEGELDEAYDRRIAITNETIRELFEQETIAPIVLDTAPASDTPVSEPAADDEPVAEYEAPVVADQYPTENSGEGYVSETTDDEEEEEYVHVDGGDYYQYIEPVVEPEPIPEPELPAIEAPQPVEEDSPEAPVEETPAEENTELAPPTEYAEVHKEELKQIRTTLQDAVERINHILGE